MLLSAEPRVHAIDPRTGGGCESLPAEAAFDRVTRFVVGMAGFYHGASGGAGNRRAERQRRHSATERLGIDEQPQHRIDRYELGLDEKFARIRDRPGEVLDGEIGRPQRAFRIVAQHDPLASRPFRSHRILPVMRLGKSKGRRASKAAGPDSSEVEQRLCAATDDHVAVRLGHALEDLVDHVERVREGGFRMRIV